MTVLTAALYFFGGAIAWSFLTRVLRNYYLLTELSFITGKVVIVLEAFDEIYTPEQKEIIIKSLVNIWPKNFQKRLAFSNWQEAMLWARQLKRMNNIP